MLHCCCCLELEGLARRQGQGQVPWLFFMMQKSSKQTQLFAWQGGEWMVGSEEHLLG